MGLIKRLPILSVLVGLTLPVSIFASYYSTNYALGFAATGMLGMFLLFGISLAIILLVLLLVERKIVYLIMLSIVVVIFFSTNYVSGEFKAGLDNQTRAQGDLLVVAIKDFQKENGRLPGSLNELIPKHIQSMPTPAFKFSSYSYSLDKNGKFYVSYNAPAWMICRRSAESGWKCND